MILQGVEGVLRPSAKGLERELEKTTSVSRVARLVWSQQGPV